MNNMNNYIAPATKRDYDDDLDSLEISLSQRTTLNDMIQLREIKERKIYLNDEVDALTVENACKMILRFNTEDAEIPPEDRKPILLHLDTYGGGVEAGFRLINTILASKTEVRTVCFGFCYSMGFLIFLAGHKRYATPYTRFLMHGGALTISGGQTKVVDQFEFNRKSEARIKEYVCGRTKITPKIYAKNYEKEWYMFGDDAKENGVVDNLIGIDCGIGEVL